MARTTKRWRLLSLFLAVLMVVSALPLAAIGAFAADADAGSGSKTTDATTTDVRAVLLDSGRMYFSVDSVKGLIDHMAEYKYNQLQLVIGNGGCRFLLDDMSLSFKDSSENTIELDSDTVKGGVEKDASGTVTKTWGIKGGNYSFNYDERCWTQSEMNTIIEYANENGIEIVPMLNMPGHATAIAYVNNSAYSASGNINVNDATARAYAVALLTKYATYFADKGCKTFSFGADESGYTGSDMTAFVEACADVITEKEMTPRAFNDATGVATFKAGIEISYWHKESGSKTVSALADTDGHNMINTHGDWYYVVKGKDEGDIGTKYSKVTSPSTGETAYVELPTLKMDGTSKSRFPTSKYEYFENDYGHSSEVTTGFKGTMFSIWCDASTLLADTEVLSENESYGALYQLTKLAEKYWGDELTEDATEAPATETDVETPNEVATEPATEPETLPANTTVNITLTVGDTSKDYTHEWSSEGASDWLYGEFESGYGDDTIAKPTIKVETETETEIIEAVTEHYEAVTEIVEEIASEPATSLSSDDKIVIGDGTNWLKLNGSTLENTNNKDEATLWTVSKSGSSYTLKSGDQYLHVNVGGSTANRSFSLEVSSSSTNWSYSSGNGFSYTYRYIYTEYITYSNSAWTVSDTSGSAKAYKQVEKSNIVKDAHDEEITPASTKTTYKSTTTVSFEALKVGTTAFYLKTAYGKTVKYNVTVVAEDFSKVDPLTVKMWITNQYVGKTKAEANAMNNTLTINAAIAYGENGVSMKDALTQVGAFEAYKYTGDAEEKVSDHVRYWKGVAHTGGGKQTQAGADLSETGNDFARIRYWQQTWQYLSGETWLNVSDATEIVAYYMQVFPVSDEIDILTQHWGDIAGQGGGEDSNPFNWGSESAYGYFGTAMAVVYGDKSMSPNGDDAIWNQSTMARYYYGKGKDVGYIYVENKGDYVVTKITITRGYYYAPGATTPITDNDNAERGNAQIWSKDGSVKWNKTGVESEEWYDETTLWAREEGDTTESILLTKENAWKDEWVTEYNYGGEAFLILVYVEPVQTETNDLLNVVYKDDTAGTIIRNDIQLSVTKGNTFLNSLNNNGSTTHDAGTIDLKDDAYILNSSGQQQTFNKRLSQVVPDNSTYNSGDYIYVSADISDDGKTLTLHYVKKNTLSVIYWDDTTNTKITTDVVNFYVVQDKNFLNGLKKGNDPISVTAGVRFDLPDGSCIDAFENAGEEDPNKAECIVISKNLTEVNASGIDISLYYYVDADVNESGTTLTIHYKKKNVLKVVYIDDSNDGKEIKTISPFVTVNSGVTFDSSYALDATIMVGGETVNKELNAALLGDDASAYADHYLYKITVEDGGLTLKLYYNKYKTLSIVWKEQGTDKIIKQATSEGLTGLPYDAAWDKDNLKVLNGGEDFSYTAETDLNKLTDLKNDDYKDYYEYVQGSAVVDGDTLILYYAKKTTSITINWIDKSKTSDNTIDSKTLTVELKEAEKLAAEFTEDSTLTIKDTAGVSYTITAKLSDNSDITEPYTDDKYYFVNAGKENDDTILNLYYDKYKTMNVVWVDKATDGEIATDVITGAKADAEWNPNTYTITNNGYVAETDLTKLSAEKLSDKKYAEHPYKLVKDDTKVVGDTLYLYYELQTIAVKVVWYDDNGHKQITSKSYTLDEGKTLADVLTNVTIDESNVILGTAPTLTHNGGTDSIEQDLTKLILADTLAVYQTGIYKYVSADLSEDKMTLTLHYTLKNLTGASLSYVLDYVLPVKVDQIKQTIADAYGIQADAIELSGKTYEGVYASVELSDDSLTYKLTSFMNGAEKVTVNAKVYDVDVTLDIHFIPATNIYYEESFFLNGAQNGGYELSNGDSQTIEWETTGTASDLFQSADKVGSRNPYGYDDAYATGLGLSAGSALKVTVPFGTKLADCPTLTFTFTGTGFDIISRTGADQGRIGVTIKQGNTVVKEYGVINRGDNELYQVPVMSVEGLEHGTYTVTITVYPPMQMTNRESGAKKFLYGTAEGATFVLDGIRIYDPVDTTDEENAKVLEAYKADGQASVNRQEIRNLLINKGDAITTTVDKGEGGSEADLSGFTNIGPNNEVYLAPGQSITFTITLNEGELLGLRYHTLLGEATGAVTFDGNDDTMPLNGKTGTDTHKTIASGEGAITVIVTNTSTGATAGWIALTDLMITEPDSAFAD